MNAKKIVGTLALTSLLMAGAVSAQTTPEATTTPGVPDTGAGGTAATNVLLLGAAAAVALAGGAYLTRRWVQE